MSKLNTIERGLRTLARGFVMVFLLGLFLSVLPVPSWSQEEAAGGATPSVEQLEKELDTARRDAAMQEKHLKNYLFPAYVIIWLLLFGYIRYVARKERDLAEQVEDLRTRVEKRE